MTDTVRGFYDDLAASYHLMFEDWEASMARQAAALAPLLERECGCSARSARILDCACGIGTQALGLAKYGFAVTGADLSPRAVARTCQEASARALDLPAYVADMRDLSGIPASGFDGVICMDNVLPHLGSEEDLARAASQIRSKLRSGGTFAGSIRDYDQLIEKRPVAQGPVFLSSDGGRRIVFQVWDWMDVAALATAARRATSSTLAPSQSRTRRPANRTRQGEYVVSGT